MAGIRNKPATPASGSVTVSVVPVPNCPTTSSAGRIRSTGGSGGGRGGMLISIAVGTAGAAWHRRGRDQRVIRAHSFGCGATVGDVRARCAAVAEGHPGAWNDVSRLTRVSRSTRAVAASAPGDAAAVRCRRPAPRPRPPTARPPGLPGRCSPPRKGPRATPLGSELHLRRIEIRLRFLSTPAMAPMPAMTSVTEVRRSALPVAAVAAGAVLSMVIVGMPRPVLVGDRDSRVRADDQQRRRDHTGSRRKANSRVRHDPFPDQRGLPNPRLPRMHSCTFLCPANTISRSRPGRRRWRRPLSGSSSIASRAH